MSQIRLVHETHTYVNDLKPWMKYTSVTTVLGKYKNKFDSDYWSKVIAERRGITQEQVLAEWKQINDDANTYGTALHSILENYLLAPYRAYTPRDDFEKRVCTAFARCVNENDLKLNVSNTIHPERIMSLEFNNEVGMAGTSDIIEDVGTDYFNVWDFKTNKKFNFDNKYNEYMKFPVDHLLYNEYNSYAMQLSIYGVMYERETGRKFRRGGLFYWDKTQETFVLIPINYLKLEAERLIDHFGMKLLNEAA